MICSLPSQAADDLRGSQPGGEAKFFPTGTLGSEYTNENLPGRAAAWVWVRREGAASSSASRLWHSLCTHVQALSASLFTACELAAVSPAGSKLLMDMMSDLLCSGPNNIAWAD